MLFYVFIFIILCCCIYLFLLFYVDVTVYIFIRIIICSYRIVFICLSALATSVYKKPKNYNVFSTLYTKKILNKLIVLPKQALMKR